MEEWKVNRSTGALREGRSSKNTIGQPCQPRTHFRNWGQVENNLHRHRGIFGLNRYRAASGASPSSISRNLDGSHAIIIIIIANRRKCNRLVALLTFLPSISIAIESHCTAFTPIARCFFEAFVFCGLAAAFLSFRLSSPGASPFPYSRRRYYIGGALVSRLRDGALVHHLQNRRRAISAGLVSL